MMLTNENLRAELDDLVKKHHDLKTTSEEIKLLVLQREVKRAEKDGLFLTFEDLLTSAADLKQLIERAKTEHEHKGVKQLACGLTEDNTQGPFQKLVAAPKDDNTADKCTCVEHWDRTSPANPTHRTLNRNNNVPSLEWPSHRFKGL
ncbi:hypothetical protein L798_02652 [Zootermopsis nevadensis]|uniref:Uncharacterized protein n=1 Tax=Zootermopsis nevadensis TaxID=136037 RepID=A0A067QRQ0_ZOONE|nr:hypothetical protein L798_02652 [Zootermopsis nevadensis]